MRPLRQRLPGPGRRGRHRLRWPRAERHVDTLWRPSDAWHRLRGLRRALSTGHITMVDNAEGTVRRVEPFHTEHKLVPCPSAGAGTSPRSIWSTSGHSLARRLECWPAAPFVGAAAGPRNCVRSSKSSSRPYRRARMSRQVFVSVIRGARHFVEEAEQAWKQAVDQHGEKAPLKFPETAFALPMILALTGRKVQDPGRLRAGPQAHPQDLLPQVPSEQLWLPYLGDGGSTPAWPPCSPRRSPARSRTLNGFKPQPRLLRLPERHGDARDGHPVRGRPHAGFRRHPGPGADKEIAV